jgi:predicted methyltransferase
MEKENLYILLDVIFRNGSIKRLARKGVDYNEIANQTQIAIKSELVTYDKERVVLTEKGLELLKQLEITYKRTTKSEWIEKDEKNRLDKNRREKNFIFVPKQNELTF